MKCQNCGVILNNDAKFCRDCGTEVLPQKKFCRDCGAQLISNAKFCTNCGVKIGLKSEISNSKPETSGTFSNSFEENPSLKNEFIFEPQNSKNRHSIKNNTAKFGNKTKEQNNHQKNFFNNLSGPKNTVQSVVPEHLDEKRNYFWEKFIKKASKKLLILLSVIVTVFILITFFIKITGSIKSNTPVVKTNYKIEKGTQYAFMSDNWNVYIAEAISDDIIKIESWDKSLSSDKKLSYVSDIGSFKINDPQNGFSWIDDEQTAFTLTFQDENNSNGILDKPEEHTFTINNNDSDVLKGSNYDEAIACYTYMNDKWHMYWAIPLTNQTMKVECWTRSSSEDEFLYGWDWGVINLENNDKKFEWTDEERTSFAVTIKDSNNDWYWDDDKFVVFEIEDSNYKYANVKDFLNNIKVD